MKKHQMKIRDIQFIKYFLKTQLGFTSELEPLLDIQVEIQQLGDEDILSLKPGKIIYRNPSSPAKFLFNILYQLLKDKVGSPIHRDQLALGLYAACTDYVYNDGESEHKHAGPPVIVDFDKLSVASFIMREIIEPLVGKIECSEVFFLPCNHIDSAQIIKDSRSLQMEFDTSFEEAEFPLVLCNCSIENSAAQLCDTTVKVLENAVGHEESQKIITNILLGNNGSIAANLVLILKTLKGDPSFVVDFLDLLESHVDIPYNSEEAVQFQYQEIQRDSYLNECISLTKTAAPAASGQSLRQWSQWSMLMGLIEKQLGPMRGSMWPASENVKPHEDKLRLTIQERNKAKGKNQANFEEMLEAARDMYKHNAVEPGKLIEVMLKDNRVWKG